ncbi:MAG: PilZ domain-containing protein [Spirochaetia bacterium]|nr:PilZ domain-containing protein [Spirochaetia bacterium]
MRVLIHTVSPARILLQDLLQKGASGVLLKPFDSDRFRKQLAFYLTRLKLSEPEKRQYLRVEPHPQDKCTVVIRDPENFRLLTGKIINLSQGGAAVEIFGNEFLSELGANTRLKNVQIFLRKENLKSDCMLVLRKGKQLCLKFVNMAQDDRDALSQYLFYALQMKIA